MPVKIENIQAIGRFEKYAAKGNTTFRDLVALYAPNGNGKSTLSDIFRSLQTGDTDIIHGRRTLNSDDPCQVVIRLQDGKQARFNGTEWNKECPEIAIFDDAFVEETVHSGNSVGPHQRQRLHQVVIGKESVGILSMMNLIDLAIKRTNDKITAEQNALATFFPNLKPKTICDIPMIEDVDEKIVATSARIQNLKQIDAIKRSPLPELVPGLSSPCGVASCLSFRLSEVITNARDQVQTHIMGKAMGAQGEKWLQDGMEWSNDGNCPFCGQKLENSPIFSLFETYFDAEYKKHIISLEQMNQDVLSSFGDKSIHQIKLTVVENAGVMKFWADKIKAKLPELDIDEIVSDAILMAGAELANLISAKTQNPVQGLSIDADAEWIETLQTACVILNEYNEAVAMVRDEATALRTSLDGGDLKAAEQSLTNYFLAKARYSHKISTSCNRLLGFEAAKKKLTKKKAELREELNELSKEILVKHGTRINTYLRQFGAKFTIGNMDTSHSGGTPRTSFDIEINKCAVKTTGGESGTPHFGNTLSTGDKRALAFAFFLSMVNQDPALSDKLIIFDDPFSSLDNFRRSRTKDRILELVGKARIVIVMSHDRDFLWQVTEKAGKQKTTLKIVNRKGGSVIEEWDIAADTLDQYEKDILQLRTYVSGENENDLLAVARALRPSLEGMFRREFPEMFGKNEWLNDMIEEVKTADADDRIYRFTPVITELEDIKKHTSPFHHSDKIQDKIAIDPEELLSFCASVLYILDGDFEKVEV